MSKQTQQRTRLSLYMELSEIVGAMKNMAEVELHRTLRVEKNQKQALATAMEGMALLHQAAPDLAGRSMPQLTILLVLGSERGFCGGFNEQLARALAKEKDSYDEIFIMGARLAGKLNEDEKGTYFAGPSTVDEILPRIQLLLDHLLQLPISYRIDVLSQGEHDLQRKQLQPSLKIPAIAPVVHVDTLSQKELLFDELQGQCLYQNLFRTMLVSLIRENRMRLQQMEGAREHIETLISNIRLRLNSLRQQEIVEEIEMILVSQDVGKN